MMLLGGTLPRDFPLPALILGFFGLYLFICGLLISIGIWVLEGFLLGRTPPE
jgi:hypothetical protein